MTAEETHINIEKALDEIRPFLISDGGNIKLLSVEDTTVKVQLEGACSGCTVNQMTLKNGVEATIKKYAPEIEEVILGLKINETKEDKFDAPTSYQDSKIAGKNLNITMTLHELKTLSIPSLDDELAKDLNFESFQKLQETIENHMKS